jgi:hypothetical protein
MTTGREGRDSTVDDVLAMFYSVVTTSHGENAMASVTYFVVLSFIRDEDGDLVPERPVERQSPSSAKSYAKALVGAGKAGAIAFQRTGDPSVGEFDDAEVLAREGYVPDDLFDLTS